MATLHIIGNDFDLVHGIASKYSDFKEYAWQHADDKSFVYIP
ncbi:MAG: bacteriophage abortive infection AbiH family protein [Bacteroidales bacterium]|nr:bacteriophage abortive infection AbiH family protein [Bacteroidales bacterium]